MIGQNGEEICVLLGVLVGLLGMFKFLPLPSFQRCISQLVRLVHGLWNIFDVDVHI